MIAAAPVMSTVPQMACTAPPPSPTTLRIELEKKVPSKRAMPYEITVQATETSGTIAMRNAPYHEPGDEAVHRPATALDDREIA